MLYREFLGCAGTTPGDMDAIEYTARCAGVSIIRGSSLAFANVTIILLEFFGRRS